MWYSMSKFGSSIQYGWSRPSGTLSSLRRKTGTSGSRSASTAVSLARVSGAGASLRSRMQTPPTCPVELAVSSARNAASSPVSCCILVTPRLVTSRVEGAQRSRRAEHAPQARWHGQPVGYQPERGRVDSESQVRTSHLDVLVQVGLRLNAGLPGDDAVAARVDGGRRHRDGLPDLLAGRHSRGRVQACPALVGAVGVTLPGVGQRERAAERDHLPDMPRVSPGKFPGVDPAEAPADNRDRAAGLAYQGRQYDRQFVKHLVCRPEIAAQAPPANLVAEVTEEPAEDCRAAVGGKQAWQHQHSVAVATWREPEPRCCQRKCRQVS